MKKVLVGGFLAVVSSMWAIAIGIYVQMNLVSEWDSSRFWSSASALGVSSPLIAALIALGLGAAILLAEYFRKDR